MHSPLIRAIRYQSAKRNINDIADFFNDTSSALKTGDVKGALQVLEKA